MIKKILSVTVFLIFACMALPGAQAETFTMDSYYPVPFAAYDTMSSNQLRIMPQSAKSSSTCVTSLDKGTMYFDQDDNCVMLCTSTGWKCVGTTVGPSGMVINTSGSISGNYVPGRTETGSPLTVKMTNQEGRRVKVDFSGVLGIKSNIDSSVGIALEVYVGGSSVSNVAGRYTKKYVMFDIPQIYDIGAPVYASADMLPNTNCYSRTSTYGNVYVYTRNFSATTNECHAVYPLKSSIVLEPLTASETHLSLYATPNRADKNNQAITLFSGWTPIFTGLN